MTAIITTILHHTSSWHNEWGTWLLEYKILEKQCTAQQGEFVSFAQTAAVLTPVFVLLFSITVIFNGRIRGLG